MGLVLGARGPYGILVRDRDSALNQWFVNTYKDIYGIYPSGPAYQYGQAILAAKIAYDKAGSDATNEQLADALRGITFESFSTTIEMKLGWRPSGCNRERVWHHQIRLQIRARML